MSDTTYKRRANLYAMALRSYMSGTISDSYFLYWLIHNVGFSQEEADLELAERKAERAADHREV